MSGKLLQQQNFYKTKLSQSISSDSTIIYVDALPNQVSGYLVISQDDTTLKEIIYYTGVGANYVSCPESGGRGLGGTTAQAHDAEEPIVMDDVAEYYNAISNTLSNYRYKAEISFTYGGDNISLSAGTVVINGSVCINSSAVTLSDIGSSGSNKDGNVSSGGTRYIFASDNGDGSFSAYVSNNNYAAGKRLLGFAKFTNGTTDTIKYIHNDDEYSSVYRGMIFDYYGGIEDIPSGYVLCDGNNGTPDLRDKIIIGAGTTYTLGESYGNSSVDISHIHTAVSTSVQHSHTIAHTHNIAHEHYVTRVNDGTHYSNIGDGLSTGGDFAGKTMPGSQSTTTSGGSSAGSSGSMSANSSHTHTIQSAGDIISLIPPVVALVKIMKT